MTEPIVKEAQKRVGGASVAWVTLFGALTGVTALVPIFPYVGGGGYVPLLVPFAAMAPLLLGPIGGITSSVIGGAIGMFLAPAAFPLGVLDVFVTAVVPAIYSALTVNNDRYWKINAAAMAVGGAVGLLVPYYIPGAAAGFERPTTIVYPALSAMYWLPSLLIVLSSLGRRLVPEWSRSNNARLRYLGILIVYLASLWVWWNPWTRPYWYLEKFPLALGIATCIGYSWWIPTLAVVITALTIPVLEALKRSGLPKIDMALW